MIKRFHLGDILSITTGRRVSPKGMNGVYGILHYMTGDDSLATPQIARAMKECRPYLLAEMPWLEQIDASNVNSQNCDQWLKDQIEKYGENHEVRPINPEDHEQIELIDELERMGLVKARRSNEMTLHQDAFLTEKQAGHPGCGKGTPNACFALTMGLGGLQCSRISNQTVAQMAGIRLEYRTNVDPTDGKAWCPKGVLSNSKLPE